MFINQDNFVIIYDWRNDQLKNITKKLKKNDLKIK